MAWVRIDDGFWSHPKVIAAGNAAIGLWIKAASYCAQHLTDGFVPDHVVPLLGGTRTQAQRLLSAKLWQKADGGWVFHDWDDYQLSKEKVLKRRAAAKGRQAAWRAAQKQKTAPPD